MSRIETLARVTFSDHHDSVVTVLMKEREPSKVCAVGSGFIIRSVEDRCLVMTCQHVFKDFDPSKHAIRTRLCNPDSEEDAELLYQDEARDLMLIRILGMPKTCPVLEFCDSSNVPVNSDVILLAYLRKITSPLQEAGGVVKHTCAGLQGCRGGPVIFQGRVFGVHTGYRSRIGIAISTETVNVAMNAWLQIPSDVIRTTAEMIQSLTI
ncbi:hypothetical protein QOZ80_2BG0176830 [Eleusine coracana subsp. coracana]|nr:hypothetical protein QOZ80_2BG0176830 [Eleusine coracana subsp. coracana]